MSEEPQSFVTKQPCKLCGSKDNVGVWSDGHTYCFGCKAYTPPPKSDGDEADILPFPPEESPIEKELFAQGQAEALPSRRLTGSPVRLLTTL